MVALNLSLEIALLMAAGFAVSKLKVFPESVESVFTKLIINVTLPCLIVRSLNVEFNTSQLRQLGVILLVSVGTIIFLFMLGQFCCYLCGSDATGRIVRFGIMFSNYTFIGLPMIESLYGAAGLFTFTVFTLPVRLVYYISPLFLLRSTEEIKSEHETGLGYIKKLLSAPFVAVLIGLGLYFGNITLPSFLSAGISSMADISSPLGMFLCGMILSRFELKNIFKCSKVLLLILCRIVIAPLFELLILMAIGLEPALIKIAVIYAGLPAASLLPAWALQYERSTEVAAQGSFGVFLTTILCIASLPVWSVILEKLLG